MAEQKTTANTIIGEGIYVEGTITVLGSISIDGTLKGDLTSTGVLMVGPKGVIEGNITAKEALIDGTINGNLTATHNTVLQPGATLNGDLYTAKVTLSEGTTFNGKCTMIKRNELTVDPKTKKVDLIELSPEQILTQD